MTDFKHGSVKISNDIIDQLIAETALQVENVNSVIGYKNKKIEKNKKDGVVAVIGENNIDIALSVIVENNVDIFKVAENIQKSIKEQINIMLGLEVNQVNVIVKSLTK